jgi:bisphosphoglycerate-dependent phosphoglycerate mutase
MDIFAEEFGDLSYSVRAFEKYYQLLHGKSRSGRQQTYTQEEINSYHRSYIQQASYVIAHPDTGVMQYHGDVKA